MPDLPPRACPRCGRPVPARQPCPRCTEARRAADNAARNPQNGAYATNAHRRRFRIGVLRRDPLCVLCGAVATVADHWPRTRRQLILDGADPNDPRHGRGLCASCHSRITALDPATRGGWNRRRGDPA
jgi:5-methylcytosine-specific restriction protein A